MPKHGPPLCVNLTMRKRATKPRRIIDIIVKHWRGTVGSLMILISIFLLIFKVISTETLAAIVREHEVHVHAVGEEYIRLLFGALRHYKTRRGTNFTCVTGTKVVPKYTY